MKQIMTLSAVVFALITSSFIFAASLNIQSGTILLYSDRAEGTWQLVTFDEPFNVVPNVVAQTVTYAGSDDPNLRIQNVTKSGFQIRFDEQNTANGTAGRADGSHATESVSWIAIAQ
ncbi:H-type lectin domain-containing protein [Gynuella sp.]|uniref:H-type lectin domain-containing protein n=1 Tax=Gynuella sp. TaxID=2969146 RepID=UPI003D0ED1A7